MIERTIPVYLGGPCHGMPLPADLHLMGALMHVRPPDTIPVRVDGDYPSSRPIPDPVQYLRRSYRVGATAALAWVVRGLPDDETAELMWTWLLDAARVPPAPARVPA